jgi:hypothetical protein
MVELVRVRAASPAHEELRRTGGWAAAHFLFLGRSPRNVKFRSIPQNHGTGAGPYVGSQSSVAFPAARKGGGLHS